MGNQWHPPPHGYQQHPHYNQQQQQFVQGWHQPPQMPDPDRWRRFAGGGCLFIGCGLGALLFLLELLGAALTHSQAAAWSVILAFVPVGLYLFIPFMMDRYDPEPWWALAGVFMWGALFATGVSAITNTVVQMRLGDFAAAAISAPLVEELTKGSAILGIVIFVRREFDGVVDGIIYGTFAGIGFAAVENVGYYFKYASIMDEVFLVRGVLSPWLHPLFTAMTGIGFGLAREHGSTWAKLVFPPLGYGAAVFLHAIWNGSSFLVKGPMATIALFGKIAIGILLALIFMVIIIRLVIRKGRVIRDHLRDEVLIGTLSQQELDLVCSAFGRFRARMRAGPAGSDFVRTAGRLALSKWHTARAYRGSKHTISADFIGPYRRELMRLRAEMGHRWR